MREGLRGLRRAAKFSRRDSETAQNAMTLRPATYDTAAYSSVTGAPTTQIAEWIRHGILAPAERMRGGRSYLFARDDVLTGAALLELQRLLGRTSPLAIELARQLAPRVRGALSMHVGELPTKEVSFVLAERGVAIVLILRPQLFADVARRLDELA